MGVGVFQPEFDGLGHAAELDVGMAHSTERLDLPSDDR